MKALLFTSVFPQTSILTTACLKMAAIFCYAGHKASSICANEHKMCPQRSQYLGLCSIIYEAAPVA